MRLPVLGLVGTGPVGCAVARGYTLAGGRVAAVVSRGAARAVAVADACGAEVGATRLESLAGADFVLLAVPDRVVAEVGCAVFEALAGSAALVCHTSGALGASALGGDAERSASLHPLQSFPAPAPEADLATAVRGLTDRLPGAHWFHDGAGEALARSVVAALGGRFHALAPGSKVLYHAGAAVLSNHTVALFAMALELFQAAGLSPEDAAEPLSALLAGTLRNLSEMGIPHALTGPVARGDVGTVSAHLGALRVRAPHLVDAYSAMGLRAVEIALAKGSLDAETAQRLRTLLGACPASIADPDERVTRTGS